MPYANLPWLEGGPQLFLQALKSGTESALQRRQQDIAAQEAANSLAQRREESQAQMELGRGRLAQGLTLAQLRAQQAEDRLGESETHHRATEGIYEGRNSILRDRLEAAAGENQNKDERIRQHLGLLAEKNGIAEQIADARIAEANARADAIETKSALRPKPSGPTLAIPGIAGLHLDDPEFQQYMSTPQVKTNSHWFGRPDTYSTNFPSIDKLDAATVSKIYGKSPSLLERTRRTYKIEHVSD